MAKAHLHNPRSHLHKDRPWKKNSPPTSPPLGMTVKVYYVRRDELELQESTIDIEEAEKVLCLPLLLVGHFVQAKFSPLHPLGYDIRRPSFKTTSVALESILKVLESI